MSSTWVVKLVRMNSDPGLAPTLDELTDRTVPGVCVGLVRRSDGANFSSAGVADLSTGTPTTPDTVFLWFSMTKIVTATAVMQLVESGTLGLDDPVRRFVRAFPETRPGWPEVLVRHLLSHSAGLANPLPVRWVHPAAERGRDPHEFARELLTRHSRLRFPAGSRAVYSNLGYIALGEVIGAAAGRRYEDYIRSEILEPLSMNCTGFAYRDETDGEAATGYQARLNPLTPVFRAMLPKGVVGRNEGRFVAFNRFYVDGPAYGDLVGSARDAARFMAAHLNEGELDGVRLLTPESIATMQRIQASGRKLDVGFGWFRRGADRAQADHLEHLGGGGGFWNMMRLYPARGLGVLAMGNATTYDHERVAEAVVQEA
jgi:CubicO group peptidase (beta-lactamase class C family)